MKNDFLNAGIVREPEGRVYTTQDGGRFTGEHEELLQAENLCGGAPRD